MEYKHLMNETDSNCNIYYPDVPSSLSIVNENKQTEISIDDFTNESIINKKKAANSSSQLQQETQNTSTDSKLNYETLIK